MKKRIMFLIVLFAAFVAFLPNLASAQLAQDNEGVISEADDPFGDDDLDDLSGGGGDDD
ncbi:hypothetical protein ACFL4E_03610 [Candidatus Omnitrophota bacterium]